MSGWVKLHRKLWNKAYSNRPAYIALWTYIIANVNHNESEFMWNGQVKRLSPGQIITGIDALSVRTGIPSKTIQRILKFFENEKQIEQQTTNRFRIITVKNWEKYQSSEKQNEKQVRNQRETSEKQVRTNKNDKKNKNEKKEREAKIGIFAPTPGDEMRRFVSEEKNQQAMVMLLVEKGVDEKIAWIEIGKFISYWTEKTKSGKKVRWELEKTFELKRRLATWFNNAAKFHKQETKNNSSIGVV